MSDFSQNLKIYRKQKKLSQQALAEILNYGSTAIANYESGRNEPSFSDLTKLADILDVTIDELLGVPLKTTEQQLLSAYKKLDSEKQRVLLELIQLL